MSFFSGIKLLLLLVAAPFLSGGFVHFLLPKERVRAGVVLLTGYLVCFASFLVAAIPCELFITFGAFNVCVKVYSVILLLLSAAGGFLLFTKVRVRPFWRAFSQMRIGVIVTGCVFVLLVLFQIGMAVTHASFDGDDAYYVTQSVLADQTGTMNTILPYTGGSSALDIRHALAVFTMWIAYVARVSGVHAAVVSHTVLPAVLLPLTYLAYACVGRILLGRRKEALFSFLLLIALLQMFGNVSIYTNETFLMTRTWQGKSMMANFALPLFFWMYCRMFRDALNTRKEAGYVTPYRMLFLLHMASGVFTSMGPVLALAMTCVSSAALFVMTRKISEAGKLFVSALPSVCYLLLFWVLLPDVFK